MKIRTLLLIAGCAWGMTLQAQNDDLIIGFRAGMNSSRYDGPLETDLQGNAVESFKGISGFHIAVMAGYKVTDRFGARAELTFSQRGTKYTFEGDSYYNLGQYTNSELLLRTGKRTQSLTVTNAFVDLPVTVYFKLGHLEVLGGINGGLMIGSTGGGSLTFEGTSPLNKPVTPFEVNFQHNYLKDGAKAASSVTQPVNVDGKNYAVPISTGAYYDFETRDKALYRSLEFGIVGGLAYYINDGLFISARYIQGLTDVDRNEYDVSLVSLQPNGDKIQRADKNTSRTWQFSIGFSF